MSEGQREGQREGPAEGRDQPAIQPVLVHGGKPFYEIGLNGRRDTVVPLGTLPYSVRNALEGLPRDQWPALVAVRCAPKEGLVLVGLARALDGLYRDKAQPRTVFTEENASAPHPAEERLRRAIRDAVAAVEELARARNSQRAAFALKHLPAAWRPQNADKTFGKITRLSRHDSRRDAEQAQALAGDVTHPIPPSIDQKPQAAPAKAVDPDVEALALPDPQAEEFFDGQSE